MSLKDLHAEWYEKDYFEISYAGYEDAGRYAVRAEKIITLADTVGINVKSVLDVGCAYGYTVRELRKVGVEAVGLDVSRYAGQKAKSVCGWYVRASATHLPFKDKCFDVVYCEGTLEHVAEPFVDQVFREFERVGKLRVLAITWGHIPPYHLCCHPFDWWFSRIPPNSYLFTWGGGTEQKGSWIYKSERGKRNDQFSRTF